MPRHATSHLEAYVAMILFCPGKLKDELRAVTLMLSFPGNQLTGAVEGSGAVGTRVC
ncbi:hypothetical protein PABY_02890 [Pyrodictium abyssi]|uniref:Uncharacterized protein n=1 Tax=Pyrodictium abyssi TaxID=54256 RepID=A0ABN6ZS57_9CREN|nr:hypothetical protein PABY_02890 [Pyrodictium abyssi]